MCCTMQMLDSVMGTCLMGVTVSYTADLVSKRNRTPAFGLLFASYLSGTIQTEVQLQSRRLAPLLALPACRVTVRQPVKHDGTCAV